MIQALFRKKPIGNAHQGDELLRCLSAWDLTLFGIGAIIGAGIFVLTGIAAATKAGPAIVLSFILAGFACGFSALSYAELASNIGGCGSAYGYAYTGLGELPAWIIGWDLLLEYALSVSAVAVGWSQYFNSILLSLGYHFPKALLYPPGQGGVINLPACLIVLFITLLLSIGVKTSARFNAVMVLLKLLVITLFVVVAVKHVNPINWHPFMPFGFKGVVSGAALIFFAYIGFDAVSTTAEEVKNPQRNLPIGIIASLVFCTLIYILVSFLLTGVAHYSTLNVSSPISHALLSVRLNFVAALVSVGAIAGLTTVVLVMYYGLTRVFLAMSRDGLFLPSFSVVNAKTRTPIRIIVLTGVIMAVFSAFMPITVLAELVNIGTLFAFTIVCAGVIMMRRQLTYEKEHFQTPLFPLIPILGMMSCVYLMLYLPVETWFRFFIWMMLGLLIYFTYGRVRSKLRDYNYDAKHSSLY